MKHVACFAFCLVFACGVQAKPFYSYDLRGVVTGDIEGVAALSDVDMGAEFTVRFNIWGRNSGEHKVSFHGVIGGWAFEEQHTVGLYYCCDRAPERFYTYGSHSPLNAPEGNGSTVHPDGINLGLFGLEQTGQVVIPEENWLIRDSGEINLNQFHSGSFYFWFFNQSNSSPSATEENLYGSITRIVEVPEPGTLLLSLLGLFSSLIKRHAR